MGEVDESAEKPHIARVYDYYLGGTDNRPVDRELADQIRAAVPEIVELAWANRGFVQRAAKWIAEQGVRQFLDVGAGLPTANNTHSVVQAIDPTAQVVYADNDAEVVRFGNELLERDHVTGARFVEHDLNDPRTILDDPAVTELIDFSQPVGLLVIGVLYFVPDGTAQAAVDTLLDALAPGSYVAISHLTGDLQAPEAVQQGVDIYQRGGIPGYLRSKAEVERFFQGLELVPPYDGGRPQVSFIGLWGAENPESAHDEGSTWFYAGVGRKG